MKEVEKKIVVNKDLIHPERLDKFLSTVFEDLSRQKAKNLILSQKVLVNGEKTKPNYLLKGGEEIVAFLPVASKTKLEPYPLKIPIIFEDEHIAVLAKPANLTVHPPNPKYNQTLLNALIYMKIKILDKEELRYGIVHRLDRETSGVMVIAKTEKAYWHLVNQFKQRKVHKEYRAIVWGILNNKNMDIQLPIARHKENRLKMRISFSEGKFARSLLETIKHIQDKTYLKIFPTTGRMHQIRIHLSFLGHPILGDRKYGYKDGFNNLFLHAYSLQFTHPCDNITMQYTQPLPSYFLNLLKNK